MRRAQRSLTPRKIRRLGLGEQLSAIPLDALGKAAAGLSAVLYGVLFLAYRAYYDRFEMNPEDVGITNSFILVRSIGFIIVTLVVFVVIVAYLFLMSSLVSTRGVSTTDGWRLLGCLGLGAFAGYYFFTLFPFSTPNWVGLVVGGAILLAGLVLPFSRTDANDRSWRFAILVLTLILAVLVPAIALVAQGVDRGNQASAGRAVSALSFFNVPLLDVSAPPVRIHWTGASPPAPSDLFSSGPPEGLLLGQTATAVVVMIGDGDSGQIVRLNSSTVALTYVDLRAKK